MLQNTANTCAQVHRVTAFVSQCLGLSLPQGRNHVSERWGSDASEQGSIRHTAPKHALSSRLPHSIRQHSSCIVVAAMHCGFILRATRSSWRYCSVTSRTMRLSVHSSYNIEACSDGILRLTSAVQRHTWSHAAPWGSWACCIPT